MQPSTQHPQQPRHSEIAYARLLSTNLTSYNLGRSSGVIFLPMLFVLLGRIWWHRRPTQILQRGKMTRLPSRCFELYKKEVSLEIVDRKGNTYWSRLAANTRGDNWWKRGRSTDWVQIFHLAIDKKVNKLSHTMVYALTYRVEHDVRRLHWVLIRQTDETVVDTTFIVCFSRSSYRKMPLKWLIFQRLSIDKDLLFRFYISVFLHYAPHGEWGSSTFLHFLDIKL